MEAFYRTHKYLVTHLGTPVRRGLMDEVDWSQRLIGIKGCREIGKTTFLLSYARECFAPDGRECLYVNLNNFIFTERTLTDFAGEFYAAGGKCSSSIRSSSIRTGRANCGTATIITPT